VPILEPVIAGFIPLLDSAVLVAAAELGFAEQEGIGLKLVRETSWANIRDRIAVGHFDVAHMLAPMPIAASLNLTSLAVPMLAPMVMGLGGNAITVSMDLWLELAGHGADPAGEPRSTGAAVAAVMRSRASKGTANLRFGVVHPFSGHAYELRYWLAAAGLDLDRDVELSVLPPQLMADALAAGQLDGYCVGEPWNTAAILDGTGRMVTYKQAIWPDSPEKVLGVTRHWAQANPQILESLLRSMAKAAEWCARKDNAEALTGLLSKPEYLGCPVSLCLPALTGNIHFSVSEHHSIDDFLSFSGGLRAAPVPEHGRWFFEQMCRWGQATASQSAMNMAAEVFSPDVYLKALKLPPVQPGNSIRLFDQ